MIRSPLGLLFFRLNKPSCNEGLADQYPCPNVILSSLKHLPEPRELGACLCNCKQQKSDKCDQHSLLWIAWLASHSWPPDLLGHPLFLSSHPCWHSCHPCSPLILLEFISPFKELWSPSGHTSCCQGVSSRCVLGNPCTEQEDKLRSGV